MITWIKKKLAERRAAAEKEQREAGFSWAAGELLMGREQAAAFVEDQCLGEEDCPFAQGALNAVYRARQCGPVNVKLSGRPDRDGRA